jgi:monofunctional glycosyltransferase
MEEPAIDIGASPARPRSRRRRRSARRRWLRVAGGLVLALLVLPFALGLAYKMPGTRPVSTLMMADLVTFRGYDRRWVTIEGMGANIVNSVMMSEDGRYCTHGGVDWDALNLVIEDAMSGERTRGASTITMQTAKNLFLWQGRSYVRKALEIPIAMYLDTVLSKKRTMEIYLNIAEWGPGIYGAEAAAQHHFGRSARDLTARQAALLAVTLPNPKARNPAAPSQGLDRLARVIERRASQAGAYIGCVR